MTTLQVPGVNVSILRERTTARRGEPLLVSGRVTALGVGVPALVRVSLEGPSFDPQIIAFDTVASPAGDYSVAVVADKEGRYTVRAQAFPALPLPGVLNLLPPLAESPAPPLVIGRPEDGGVAVEGPLGLERVPLPPPTSVEVQAPITVSAVVPVTVTAPTPARLAAPPAARAGPPPGAAAPPSMVVLLPEEVEAGVVGAQIAGFTLEGV